MLQKTKKKKNLSKNRYHSCIWKIASFQMKALENFAKVEEMAWAAINYSNSDIYRKHCSDVLEFNE